ncbi:MAG: hypothetical protein ACYTGB_05100 [Planctomycetota bacterium]
MIVVAIIAIIAAIAIPSLLAARRSSLETNAAARTAARRACTTATTGRPCRPAPEWWEFSSTPVRTSG